MEKRYCAAPWRSLHINFLGQTKTCCAGDPGMLGSLTEQTIEEILSSEVLVDIKKTILKGELHPKYCHNCIQSEKYGSSERDWHNNLNQDFDIFSTDIHEHKPVLIDVRWNTTCNLSCNYCSPWCSSKWASIRDEQTPDTSIREYYTQVVDYINKNIETVKEVALVGGEPLLLKENIPLLEILPDDVLVTVITNLSINFEKNKIAQKLLSRKRTGWSISFDNIGERFEYVRYGGNWNLLDQNVSTVSDLINHAEHHGGIHAVYNLYNCTRLCELKQYSIDKKINIHWQTLHFPDMFDPLKHSVEIRNAALDEIYNLENKFTLDQHDTNFLHSVKSALEHSLTQKTDLITESRVRHEFLDWTDKLESQWHPNSKGQFIKLWPELARLF